MPDINASERIKADDVAQGLGLTPCISVPNWVVECRVKARKQLRSTYLVQPFRQ